MPNNGEIALFICDQTVLPIVPHMVKPSAQRRGDVYNARVRVDSLQIKNIARLVILKTRLYWNLDFLTCRVA